MDMRKLITYLSILFLLGGMLVVLFTVLTASSGSIIYLQPTLVFSIPAFVVILFLLVNFKIKGQMYQRLLIAAVLVLGIFSIFEPGARIPSAISLIAVVPMYLLDRQRELK